MENKTENTVSDSAQLDIQNALGGQLWRNNSGVAPAIDGGRPVRYGLGNVSKKLNKKWKSSDLIGLVPLVIDSSHVGKTVGVFVAVEVKKPGWKYSEKDLRAVAQNKFIQDVISMGGYGFFLNSDGILVPYMQDLMR